MPRSIFVSAMRNSNETTYRAHPRDLLTSTLGRRPHHTIAHRSPNQRHPERGAVPCRTVLHGVSGWLAGPSEDTKSFKNVLSTSTSIRLDSTTLLRGVLTHGAPRRPVTKEQPMRIASCTKSNVG